MTDLKLEKKPEVKTEKKPEVKTEAKQEKKADVKPKAEKKTVKKEVANMTTQAPPPAPRMMEGEKIWNEIKNMGISIFSLPQTNVGSLFEFVNIDPSKCFLTYGVTASLPALEDAIGKKYSCEVMNKYIVVSRANV